MKYDYDVMIIGAGPAGISSSIYLKRSNLNIAILEKNIPGGLLNKSSIVENYPGFVNIDGPSLAMKFFEQIKEVPYINEEVLEIESFDDYKVVKTNVREYVVKAVILCIGREPKKLNTTNEEKLEGRGISFCSLCDGFLYKNEEVAIVGGGNSALEEALYLSTICKKVYVLNKKDKLTGDDLLINRINEKENIEVIYNSSVIGFNSNDDVLESIDLDVSGDNKNLKVKACFIFIGYEPATKFLKNLDILDEKGYIIVDSEGRTKIKNIYAAGDIVKKEAYQIVTANADGATSAIACIKDLGK